MLRPLSQELTRTRCFDGAYARGLWAAGFTFDFVADAAVFTDVLPGVSGCRQGASLVTVPYSAFLQVGQGHYRRRIWLRETIVRLFRARVLLILASEGWPSTVRRLWSYCSCRVRAGTVG